MTMVDIMTNLTDPIIIITDIRHIRMRTEYAHIAMMTKQEQVLVLGEVRPPNTLLSSWKK